MTDDTEKPYQLWEEHPHEGFYDPRGFDSFEEAKAAAEADSDVMRYIISGPIQFDSGYGSDPE